MFPLGGTIGENPSHAVRLKLGIPEKGFDAFGNERVPGLTSGIGLDWSTSH